MHVERYGDRGGYLDCGGVGGCDIQGETRGAGAGEDGGGGSGGGAGAGEGEAREEA